MDQAAALEALITHLDHERRLVDYLWVAAPVIMIWDYFLCLDHEIKYVWRAKWNYTTFLFLIVRYIPLVSIYFMIHFQIVPDVTLDSCKNDPAFIQWILLIGVLFAEIILMIRTWAIWHQNKWVGAALVIMQAVSLISSCIGNNNSVKSFTLAPAPYPGFRGCFVVSVKNSLPLDFIVLTIYQAITIALIAISAHRSYKHGDRNKLSTMIHRDGILFYVYLLIVTLVNAVILEVSPVDIGFGVIPIWAALYSVLTCRVVLRIRHLGSHGLEQATLLHRFHEDMPGSIIPMSFRSRAEIELDEVVD